MPLFLQPILLLPVISPSSRLCALFCFLCAFCSVTFAHAQSLELIWADEFDGTQVDRDTWDFWEGTAFNNELQYYTDRPENVFVNDGLLNIVGRSELFGGRSYTSARMRTKGTQFFTYGRFEVRAKLPEGQGLWPAIWMLHNENIYGGWPYSGEIDIMEYRGDETDAVHGNVHYAFQSPSGNPVADRRDRPGSFRLSSGTFADDFHVFAVEWDEGGIRWFVDGERYHEITRASLSDADPYPFDIDFFLILNLAIGGDYLQDPVPGVSFVETMQVDYVRVYQRPGSRPTAELSVANARVASGSPVSLAVDAQDDVAVDSVVFRAGSERLFADVEAPFAYDWFVTDGCYDLTATAYDDEGRTSVRQSALSVVVGSGCRARSFDGRIALPGIVELVRYDTGGQDVSYYDTTPFVNLGVATGSDWRPNEGVDTAPIVGEAGAYVVSDVEEGEWLAYRVDVTEAGSYDIALRAASASTRPSIELSLDGVGIARFLTFPGPAEGQTFAVRTIEGIELPVGQQTLRIDFGKSGVEAHQIVFSRSLVTSTASPSAPAALTLHPATPNPFETETRIRFELAASTVVDAHVFDVLGRQVRTLAESVPYGSGAHELRFDAAGLTGGVYIVRLATPTESVTRQVTVAL